MEKRCILNGVSLFVMVCLSTVFYVDYGHGRSLMELGNKQMAADQYEEAINYYTQAVKADPDSGDAVAMLTQAYFKRGTQILNQFGGKKAKAVVAFTRAIELNPEYYEAYTGRQIAYEYMGEGEKALADCNKKMELKKPDRHFPYYNRGRLYLKVGKNNEAIADFNRALALKSDYYLSFGLRGEAYGNLGDYEKAIADYTQAIMLNPDPLPTYLARGIAYGKLSQFGKAIEEFNRLIEKFPKYSEAFYARAKIYREIGSHDRAIADFSKSIRLEPEDPFGYYYRAGEYIHMGQYKKAVADYGKALELKQNFYSVYSMRALAYRCMGQYGKAIADYNKKIKSDPDNPYLYLFRYIASKHGNYDDGNVLQDFAYRFNDQQWISAVADLYLGKITPQACLNRANHANSKIDREQKCEAYYYVGEYYLFKNDEPRAKEFFRKCLNTGENRFTEYALAKLELNRL